MKPKPQYAEYGPLLVDSSSVYEYTLDEDFGTIPFGNPFPDVWTPYVSYVYGFAVYYQLPGIYGDSLLLPAIYVSSTNLATDAEPIRPQVSPVQSPTINGKNFYATQFGVGSTPTIAWQSPAIGSPTAYNVEIYEIGMLSPVNAMWPDVSNWNWELYTTKNSVTLPPGLLETGKIYAIDIVSVVGGPDAETGVVGRSMVLDGWAETVSGAITP